MTETDSEIVFKTLAHLIFFGLYLTLGLLFGRLQKRADRIFLGIEPSDNDVVSDDAANSGIPPVTMSRRQRYARMMGILLGWFIPLLAIGAIFLGAEVLPLPDALKPILLLVGLALFFVFIMFWFPRRMQKRLENAIRQEYGEDSEELHEYRESIKARPHSYEGLKAQYQLIGVMLYLAVGVSLLWLATFLIDSLGIDRETRNVIIILMLFSDVIGFALMFWVIEKVVDAKIPYKKLLSEADQALQRGAYALAIEKAEAAMALVPGYETQFPSALIYLMAGQLDKAAALTNEAMTEVFDEMRDKEKQDKQIEADSLKPLLAKSLLLEGEISMARGQYAEAEEKLRRAVDYDQTDATMCLSLAEALLHQNRPTVEVSAVIKQAQERHRKHGGAANFGERTCLALTAWVQAVEGNIAESNRLIQQAIGLAQAEHERKPLHATMFYFAGYVAKAQGKATSAQIAWQRVLKLDPDGLQALLARQAMVEL